MPDSNSCRIKPMIRARASLIYSVNSATVAFSAAFKSRTFRRRARDHTDVSTIVFTTVSNCVRACSRRPHRIQSLQKATERSAAFGV
jgi:hypothetical protein